MDGSLLDADKPEELSDAFIKNLLLNAGNPTQPTMDRPPQTMDGVPFIVIQPTPGFCMKTRTESGHKVFINICHSENVPEPRDITDDELIKVLESEDPGQFRIPMSIGEPHAEVDKGGSGCTAYDVVIHPHFVKKMERSELIKTFFLTVMCEGVETKFDILLKRDWIFLKNRKCVGKLAEHNVRTKSKPVIMDMSEETGDRLPEDSAPKRDLIQEVQEQEVELIKKAQEPKFSIVQEPVDGHPEFLVAEIHLPNIKTAASLTLDVGEDRLVLTTRSHVYHLDVFLPFDLLGEECGAQFDRVSKVLTVTIPVQPQS